MEAANGGDCKKESTSEETQCYWVGCAGKAANSTADGQESSTAHGQESDKDSKEVAERQKRISAARSRMRKSLASEQAESAAERAAHLVAATAKSAGVAEDVASEAGSKVLVTARAEAKGLSPVRLGRIAAEEFLQAIKTVSSEVRAHVVSLAGQVILICMSELEEDLETSKVVEAMASDIADALGLIEPTTSGSADAGYVQLFGSTQITTAAPIPIFPKPQDENL